jgi:HipA-like protein
MAGLSIYFESRVVGRIDVERTGPGFSYDPRWIRLRGAFPISLTMPLRPERVSSDVFLPWAANLLPESQQLRTLGEILGMARSDVIGLLSTTGGETAGALSFGQAGRTGSFFWRPVSTPDDLERLIEELPNKPFLVGDEGLGSPSTYVLKPDAARLPGGVQSRCLSRERRASLQWQSMAKVRFACRYTTIANSVMSNNSLSGLQNDNGVTWLAKTVISGNATGVVVGGTVNSYGDNYIRDNTTPISGSLTPVSTQ